MGLLAAARFPIFSAETETETEEIAVAVLDEARRGFLVQVSHGICPQCFEKEKGSHAA